MVATCACGVDNIIDIQLAREGQAIVRIEPTDGGFVSTGDTNLEATGSQQTSRRPASRYSSPT